MKIFWPLRIAMLIWGGACAYYFTGRWDITSYIFLSQAIGNTLIMYVFFKWDKQKII